ncbi:MAG: hypothetical protein H6818_18945 [Phycisphaerales bacterium]|nr:hypothetical protein [Phycisphaerales bacterium]MCB9863826.1 hypothetical protein [Phycisphaerales bacterium]
MLCHTGSNYTPRKSRRMSAVVGLVALAWALPVQADQNFKWRGTFNNNWQNPGNWEQEPGSGDIPGGAGHHVRFPDSADRFNVDLNNGGRTVNSFTINTTGPNHDYRFFNGQVTLQGDLNVTSTGLPVNFDTDLVFRQSTGGTWFNDSGALIFNGPLTGSAGIIISTGVAQFNAVCTYSGTMQIDGSSQVILGDAASLKDAKVVVNAANGLTLNGGSGTVGALGGTGSINIAAGTLTIGTANTNLSYSGTITGNSGSGPKLVKSGTATQTFAGAVSSVNSFTVSGGAAIFNGTTCSFNEPTLSGALVVDAGDLTIQNGSVTLSAAVSAGGTVRINNSHTLTIDGGKLTCARILTNSSGLVRISDGGESALVIGQVGGIGVDAAFDGTIEDAAGGAGSIRKVGSGTLTISNDLENTGGLTIEGGTVKGSISVPGLTHVMNGGHIAPGQSAGTFTVDDAVFDSGSHLDIEIGGAGVGSQSDYLLATGSVTLAGALDLSYINNFTAAPGDSFLVLQADTLTGQFDAVHLPDGQTWNVDYDYQLGTVSVNVCADPESSECAACDSGAPFVTNTTQHTMHLIIQGAIDAANAGDTLELRACVYHESGIVLPTGKHLVIRGQGRDQTIIDGDYAGTVLQLNADNDSTIENLTIRRGISTSEPTAGGLTIRANCDVTIRGVDIRECDAGTFSQGGVSADSGASLVTFEGCRFLDNISSYTSACLAIGNTHFVNCLFAGNSGAIQSLQCHHIANANTQKVVNCTFADNADDYAMIGSQGVAIGCVFDSSNPVGVFNFGATAQYSLLPGGTGTNTSGVPTFVDAANGDYSLAESSLGIDAADYDAYVAAGGGANDLGGDVRLVDDVCVTNSGVGAADYLDIGAFEFQGGNDIDNDGVPDACDADCSGFPAHVSTAQELIDAINCANNQPDANTIYLDADITLTAVDHVDQGANGLPTVVTPIIIEGQGRAIERGADPVDPFRLFHIRVGGDLTLNEITLRNGSSDPTAPSSDRRGGAVMVANGKVTITNSVIADNQDSAIYLLGLSPTATLDTVTMYGNDASAGGIGSAISALRGGALTVRNSIIVGNKQHYGGVIAMERADSQTVVTNTIISGNRGPNGISMMGTLTLVNSTVAGNHGGEGAAVYTGADGHSVVINSVIWGNAVSTESQVYCDGTLDVSYSGIEGGVAGITGAGTINDNGGNLNFSSSDSIFVNPVDPASAPTTTGDYHLAPNSLAIDAGGNTEAANAGLTTDFEGDNRIIGMTVDMGADEARCSLDGDDDGDGVCNSVDVCPAGDNDVDTDNDGVPDACDNCPNTPNVRNLTQNTVYATIQAAVDAAVDGDAIELGACTFHESLIMIPPGVNLTISGQGYQDTTIDCGGPGPVFIIDGQGDVNESVIEKMNIIGVTDYVGVAIGQSDAPTLHEVWFSQCSGTAVVAGGDGTLLDRCGFIGNDADAGVIVARDTLLRQCVMAQSTGPQVRVLPFALGIMINCTVNATNGVLAEPAGDLAMANTIVKGPVVGSIFAEYCMYAGATGNSINVDPVLSDSIYLVEGSPAIDAASYVAFDFYGGGAVDALGETRLLDDLGTANTGLGDVNYLDIGAVEFTGFTDTDDDGIGDALDVCPGSDDALDADNDGVPDGCDVCPGGDDNVDANNNGIPDACDTACPGGAIGDVNTDGFVDTTDVAAFADVLLDPDSATADQICAADVNTDGSADGDDVQGFVELLMAP